MTDLLIAIITQALTFIPLAFGISISYNILRATDMTIDGSFVLGAALFARLVTTGCPPIFAAVLALAGGAAAGILAATIQRGGRVDPLLAGVLATFILSSVNLSIMGKPNIGLLSETTMLSGAFAHGQLVGWCLVGALVALICSLVFLLLLSRFGLVLRAFGDNPQLLQRLGKNIETYRLTGFALTNALAAAAGCLTAQTIGYADVGMGFGMTLTGIGAIILGQQLLYRLSKRSYFRVSMEFFACLLGVILYFTALNTLLRFDIDPVYLKMLLGIVLIIFLRAAQSTQGSGDNL